MKFTRLFTTADRPVVDQIKWKTVPVAITGKAAQVPNVEVPAHWSQNAANILADKYLRKAGVPKSTEINQKSYFTGPSWLAPRIAAHWSVETTGPEISASQVFHRLAGAWTYWGWQEGYFQQRNEHGAPLKWEASNAEKQAVAFYDEVYWCLAMQIAAPNSPQWFNTGLHWAYGIEGPDSGMWRVDDETGAREPYRVHNSYEYPQPHACFLTPVIDDLVNEGGIMDAWVREARIFKHGSGSGINVSAWRGPDERLSGGGRASGAMSWLRIGDAAAGAIQSGGTTRRAAKMVCMDVDHPEVEDFIDWKVNEEYKAAAMDVGAQVLCKLTSGEQHPHVLVDGIGSSAVVPQPLMDRIMEGMMPKPLPATWESENIRTIDGQNSNNSLRVTDEFMRRTEQDGGKWELTARTTGEVVKTLDANLLWQKICRAAWACADPGLLFHDTINAWNTCAADGEIKTTNPCAEFHHLDGSACNLASLNLVKFLNDDGTINVPSYEHVCRLWTIVLDISVSMASFPAMEFAVGAYNYRTLGLGYMNLGGLLMRLALPYDSDEGRALAAVLTALMTGAAYQTSAELAEELGPFPRWEANEKPFRDVMQKHADACFQATPTPQSMGGSVGVASYLWHRAQTSWDAVLIAKAFRNAQTTLIAPTGTISLVTDCDTSGIEPDYALVKHKNLAGGGSMRIVNQGIEPAMRRLGYSEKDAKEIIAQIAKYGELPTRFVEDTSFAGYVKPEHRAVFATVAELEPMAHVKMVSAVQPFLSGAASKTINLPNSATVEDVSRVYREAWRLGIKAIALYRDGSKLTQPLQAAKPKPAAETAERGTDHPVALASGRRPRQAVDTPERSEQTSPPGIGSAGLRGTHEYLPWRRVGGYTQKAKIGDNGLTLFWRTGEYLDGRLGEVFIELSHEGTTLRAAANCLAIAISTALQHGTPLEALVDKLLLTKFEPAGYVEGHERIRFAHSFADLIARDLAITYLGREDLATIQVVPTAVVADQVVALDRRGVAIARGGQITGEFCRSCGGLLVQTGTCKTCTDCGWNEGCGG